MTTKLPLCRTCHKPFKKSSPSQKDCHQCSKYLMFYTGMKKGFLAKIDTLKEEADQSGNAKVWTAEEFSQEFLKNLVDQKDLP